MLERSKSSFVGAKRGSTPKASLMTSKLSSGSVSTLADGAGTSADGAEPPAFERRLSDELLVAAAEAAAAAEAHEAATLEAQQTAKAVSLRLPDSKRISQIASERSGGASSPTSVRSAEGGEAAERERKTSVTFAEAPSAKSSAPKPLTIDEKLRIASGKSNGEGSPGRSASGKGFRELAQRTAERRASAEGASPGEWAPEAVEAVEARRASTEPPAHSPRAGSLVESLVSGRTATAPSPPPSALNRSATTAIGLGANAGEEASKEAAAMRQVAHAAGVGRLLSSSALTLSFFGSILDGSGLTSGAGVADYAGAADGDAGIAWHDDEVALVPTFVTEAAQLREQHVLVTLRMRSVGGHQLTPRGEKANVLLGQAALPLHGPRPGAPAAFATKLLRRGLPAATLRGVLEICDERGNPLAAVADDESAERSTPRGAAAATIRAGEPPSWFR